MGLYGFRDLETVTSNARGMPSEGITFAGNRLDEILDGYRTINVAGRDGFSRAITAPDLSSDGGMYLTSRYEARTITVTFQMIASSAADMVAKFDALKRLISAKQADISFADDPDWHYIGIVQELTESNAGNLEVVDSFKIQCPMPFKYSAIKTLSSATSTLSVSDTALVDATVPNRIAITIGSTITAFKLSSTNGQSLNLAEGMVSGDKLVINFKDLSVIFTHGATSASLLPVLTLGSNLGDFTIKANDVLTATGAQAMQLEYRVVKI